MPPQDQMRSACASARSSPRPCDAPADTSTIARSPEMPKRHSRRRSQAWPGGPPARSAAERGRVRHRTSAVLRLWIAAKFSAPMRSSRSRMPVSVADISEARCTWLACRYLSITALSTPPLSDAAVAKVSSALACGSMRRCTASAHTGSRPVSSATSASDGVSNTARGWFVPRLRPSQRRRSVCTCTACTGGSLPARKCAAHRPCSVARRGVRSNTSAWCAGRQCARRNRFENAGWASSARSSASVGSKADSSSSSSVRSPRLRNSTWRNSMSSSGLTHTVVWASSSGHSASKQTRSAW